MGDSVASLGRDRLFFAVIIRSSKRRIDHAVAFYFSSPDQCLIAPVKIMCCKHAGKIGMRHSRFRGDHDA